jgi:hypothetical protein
MFLYFVRNLSSRNKTTFHELDLFMVRHLLRRVRSEELSEFLGIKVHMLFVTAGHETRKKIFSTKVLQISGFR